MSRVNIDSCSAVSAIELVRLSYPVRSRCFREAKMLEQGKMHSRWWLWLWL